MIQMDSAQIKNYIEAIGPWHYCWKLPSNHLTGDSAPNLIPEKMPMMIESGAFARDSYPEVLDLGANSGYISKWFVENKDSHVLAVERGEKFWLQLNFIVEVYGLESRIATMNAPIEACAWMISAPYDLIIFLGTLHHIQRKHHDKIFEHCFQALRPGGEIVIQTKREEDVIQKFEAAGFEDADLLYWSDKQERGAWVAKRPK